MRAEESFDNIIRWTRCISGITFWERPSEQEGSPKSNVRVWEARGSARPDGGPCGGEDNKQAEDEKQAHDL
jgi:hypothetical protein